MQTKNINLSLKSYLDISQLLKEYRGSHEENRIFALKQEKILKNPVKLLLLWSKSNRVKLSGELDSKNHLANFSSFSSISGFLFFIIGLFVGFGLLSYSGKAPVNIIYYLLVAVAIPLFSISLSLLSMFVPLGMREFLSYFFPLHWVEKLFRWFSVHKKLDSFELPLSTELSRWIFLERIQLFSLFFSIGLILSLLFMIVVKDIAFGWSTTLHLSPESFQSMVASIGVIWRDIIPSAIPSLELVEVSHYFRLGERLDGEMVHNADQLGAWWKFLAMSTLTYAIGFRFVIWSVSRYGFNRELERELLALDGVDRLIREFNTPFVSTKALKEEKHLEILEETKDQVCDNTYTTYHTILGWNFSKDEIILANDSKKITASHVISVGGSNSFDEDEACASEAKGLVLLYVKSWEPPTMDFVDLLEMLLDNRAVEEVQVYPLGTLERYYESEEKNISVWKRKIQGLKLRKVWVIEDAK